MLLAVAAAAAFGANEAAPAPDKKVNAAPQEKANPLTLAEGAAEVKFANLASASPVLYLTVLNSSAEAVKNVCIFATGITVEGKPDDRNAAIAIAKLDAGARQALKLSMRLPAAGEYTSNFWLTADGVQPKSVPVKFVRVEAPKTPLAFDEIGGLGVELPFWSSFADTKFHFSAKETSGVSLPAVTPFVRLIRKVNDKVKITAPAPEIAFDEYPLQFSPEQWKPVSATLKHIGGAGEYEAKLFLRTETSAPVVSAPFAIYVRQSKWLAALLILVGVIVSLLLRLLTKVIRPRLALQQRVAVLFDEIDSIARRARGHAIAAERVSHLKKAIEDRWDTLALTGRLIGSSAFDIYEAKVPLLGAWVDQELALENRKLPADAATLARKGLDDAAAVIDDANATAELIGAQVTALAALRGKIDAAVATEIHTRMTDLRSAIAGDPRLAVLAPKVEAVDKLAGHDLSGALSATEELRIEYVRASAGSLREVMKSTPAGFGGNWPAVVTEAEEFLKAATSATDGELAIKGLRNAMLTYLHAAGTALSNELEKKLTPPPAGDTTLGGIQKRLIALMADVDAGKLDGAIRTMVSLQREYKITLTGKAQGETAAAPDVPAAGSGVDTLTPFDAVPAASTLARAGAVSSTRRKQLAVSVIATLLIAIVAVILGVKVLWSDDWTWGGAQAYLIAFLWGAGLHQFTFGGISGLMDRW
jgi:hypothetical protein